jgi:anti-sigma factor RsiW
MTEPISELDLMAQVDDQIGSGRRIEVGEYLSRQSTMAARGMADLRRREELRQTLTGIASSCRAKPTMLPVR